jgi:hypothetical protein
MFGPSSVRSGGDCRKPLGAKEQHGRDESRFGLLRRHGGLHNGKACANPVSCHVRIAATDSRDRSEP